jgi:hypothetical protein
MPRYRIRTRPDVVVDAFQFTKLRLAKARVRRGVVSDRPDWIEAAFGPPLAVGGLWWGRGVQHATVWTSWGLSREDCLALLEASRPKQVATDYRAAVRYVRWLATEDGSTGKGTGRHIAAFILRARQVRHPGCICPLWIRADNCPAHRASL